MRLVFDRAAQKAALKTIRELIDAGLAGNDSYQHEIFVVDAPPEQRDLADVALDILGASFHRPGAFASQRHVLQCQLPHWVRAELDLDKPDAPKLVTPLCSSALARAEHRMDVEYARSLQAAASANTVLDVVFGPVAPTAPLEPVAAQLRLVPGGDR